MRNRKESVDRSAKQTPESEAMRGLIDERVVYIMS